MQGLRRGWLAPSSGGQRPRYCRRCGAPLALAPGSSRGVRCSNCGAAPGGAVRSDARLMPPVIETVRNERRLVPVSMNLGRKALGSVEPTAAVRSRMRETTVALLVRARGLAGDLPEPTAHAWITAAAVGIAIAVAVAVALMTGG